MRCEQIILKGRTSGDELPCQAKQQGWQEQFILFCSLCTSPKISAFGVPFLSLQLISSILLGVSLIFFPWVGPLFSLFHSFNYVPCSWLFLALGTQQWPNQATITTHRELVLKSDRETENKRVNKVCDMLESDQCYRKKETSRRVGRSGGRGFLF